MSSPVLGIDLGTTNAVVAVAEGGRAQVLADAEGHRLIPSVVSFHPAGDVLVGHPARERRLIDAPNTIYSVKRLLGRPYASDEVRRARERFPFALVPGPGESTAVEARGRRFTLPEISALVLREVRRVAEQALGVECGRAVVTVPANFTELQRSATKAAAKIAGLEVLRILNEPTAAALAYGFGSGTRERIAVYDLGGGTFDVTILELAGDVFEVMSTAGDTFLGGDDVDLAIAEEMANAFFAQYRIDVRRDPQTYERLRAAAEWAKCQLSEHDEVALRVEDLACGPHGATLDLVFSMTRARLEELIRPLLQRTFDVCEEAMRIAGLRPVQIDNVILVGGSTRMPLVRAMVGDYFGREPLATIDPDVVVAQGAALQGWALRGKDAQLPPSSPAAKVQRRDSTERRRQILEEIAAQRPVQPAFAPPEQGVPAARGPADPEAGTEQDEGWLGPKIGDDERTLIRRSPFESEAGMERATSGPPSDPAPSVPPAAVTMQRAVLVGRRASMRPPPAPPARGLPPAPATRRGDSTLPLPLGTAGQGREADAPPVPPAGTAAAGMPPPAPVPVAPPVRPPLLLDVTPHSLGVETVDGYCEPVIKRNAAIPVEQTKIFTTARDMQDTVRVRIVQGESRRLADNHALGEIELSGLRPAPRGQVKIGVTFVMDADGTLDVKATDIETGRAQSIRIQLIGAISDDEMAAMAARQQAMMPG
jgi:molecular chaperone DnaK